VRRKDAPSVRWDCVGVIAVIRGPEESRVRASRDSTPVMNQRELRRGLADRTRVVFGVRHRVDILEPSQLRSRPGRCALRARMGHFARRTDTTREPDGPRRLRSSRAVTGMPRAPGGF